MIYFLANKLVILLAYMIDVIQFSSILTVVLWSLVSLIFSFFINNLKLEHLLIPKYFYDIVNDLKLKNNNHISSLHLNSLRLLHSIPIEIFFITSFIKYIYIYFFVLSSYILNLYIVHESYPTYYFYSLLFGVIIAFNSLYLTSRLKIILNTKILISILIFIFFIYIIDQNTYMCLYWLLNSSILPLLYSFYIRKT
jgi:hypothetical protein